MKKFFSIVIQLVLGGAIGALGGMMLGRYVAEFQTVWAIPITILAFVIFFFVHIILHEGGHLVCGLLSGYKFVSFRVGSHILIKNNGTFYLKKFSIPGTAGQCLLDPPDVDTAGSYPAKLYNLGGGLSNLLFAALAFLIVEVTKSTSIAMILLPFVLLGVYLALMNLIPLKLGGIANDGYNILSLDKDLVGRKALWQQLRVNRLQSDGVRLKDMDPGLFDLAQSDVEGNPLVDQMKLFYLQRLLDENRFEEALALGEYLATYNALALFKNMVQVELLFMELIGPCRESEVKRMYNKAMKKWLKAVKGYPSTHRVRYAYAVCFAQDEKMAAKSAAAFEKACRSYPMAGEIETEKELFNIIKKEK